MNYITFKQWWEVMNVNEKNMRTLRKNNDTATVEKWKIGRNFSPKTILQSKVCWVQRRCYEKCWTEQGEQVIRSGEMRTLRFENISPEASCRQESIEQRKGERSNSLSSLSYKGTYGGWVMGKGSCQNCIMHCLWESFQVRQKQEQQTLQEPGLPKSIRGKNEQEEMAGIQQGKKMRELRKDIYLQEESTDDLLFIMCEQTGVETAWKIETLPRLIHRPKNRIERIRITGNIQVPAVVRLAWRILTNEY